MTSRTSGRPPGDVGSYQASRQRSLADRANELPQMINTPEIRVDCGDDIKFDVVARAVEHFSRDREVIAVDGARVLFGDGWGLVRASNTQPILVLRFEALTRERLAEIRQEMEGWLRSQGVQVTAGSH